MGETTRAVGARTEEGDAKADVSLPEDPQTTTAHSTTTGEPDEEAHLRQDLHQVAEMMTQVDLCAEDCKAPLCTCHLDADGRPQL